MPLFVELDTHKRQRRAIRKIEEGIVDPEDVEGNAANQVFNILASDDSGQAVVSPFALQCASSASHRDPANQVLYISASDDSNKIVASQFV